MLFGCWFDIDGHVELFPYIYICIRIQRDNNNNNAELFFFICAVFFSFLCLPFILIILTRSCLLSYYRCDGNKIEKKTVGHSNPQKKGSTNIWCVLREWTAIWLYNGSSCLGSRVCECECSCVLRRLHSAHRTGNGHKEREEGEGW